MFKRTLPLLLVLALCAFPLTAYAADGDAQTVVQSGTDQDVPVTVITAGDSSGTETAGVVGRLYYPTEIKTMEENGEKLLIKTFEVPAGVNSQLLLVEENLTRGELTYEAREILKRQLPGSEDTKLATTQVSVQTKSNDPVELSKLLAPITFLLDCCRIYDKAGPVRIRAGNRKKVQKNKTAARSIKSTSEGEKPARFACILLI